MLVPTSRIFTCGLSWWSSKTLPSFDNFSLLLRAPRRLLPKFLSVNLTPYQLFSFLTQLTCDLSKALWWADPVENQRPCQSWNSLELCVGSCGAVTCHWGGYHIPLGFQSQEAWNLLRIGHEFPLFMPLRSLHYLYLSGLVDQKLEHTVWSPGKTYSWGF